MNRTRGALWGWRPALIAATTALAFMPSQAHAIPAWSRRYNMNCTGCHFPVPPVLNADGLAFKWAGYRMPDQIGTSVEVTKIGDYLAARGIFQYAYEKSSDAPADVSGFAVPEINIFAAGPFGKYFGGFIEIAVEPDGVGTAAQATVTWGKEDDFWTVRLVQEHLIQGSTVAGFDRQIGVQSPLFLEGSITAANPWGYSEHTGLDLSWSLGKKNRASVAIANSQPNITDGSASTKQDVILSEQYIWDTRGGGMAVVGAFGNAIGADPADPTASSRFYRIGLSASHWMGDFQAIGGYSYGKETGLPTGGAFTASTMTGQTYWLGAAYTQPKSFLTFYGRWENVDPDQDVADDGYSRIVIGGVTPLMTPEYLKLNLEYFNDSPQLAGAPSRMGLYLELTMAY